MDYIYIYIERRHLLSTRCSEREG